MKRYCIKCTPGNSEYIEILEDFGDEYLVRFTREYNGRVKTTEETITRHLFNICLQTGYIYSLDEANVA